MGYSSKHDLLQCVYGTLFTLIIAINSTEEQTLAIGVPVEWDRVCPFTDICNHTSSKEFTLGPEQTPCCEKCSCHLDCGLERNCCLYSMDRYKLDERFNTTCTILDISSIKSFYGYRVVDQCSNSTLCSTTATAPWGSIYPVYSNKSKMIYANDVCAACNGETDVEKWDVEVSCPMETTFDSHISDGLEKVLLSAIGDCELKFLPPTHADVRRHICQRMARDQSMDCLTNYSDTHNHLAALCRGLIAPFTHAVSRFRYNNIFCYLCTRAEDPSIVSKYIEKYPICQINEGVRGTGALTSLLLAPDTLQMLTDKRDFKDVGEIGCNSDDIVERKTGRCRKTTCAESQFKIFLKCIHLSHNWIAGPFKAFIRLDPIGPNDMIPLDFIESLSERKTKMFRNRLKSWQHLEFYSSRNNGSFVDFLMVLVWRDKVKFNPEEFLTDFHNNLKTTWTTKVMDKVIRMKANFNKYYKYEWAPYNHETLNAIWIDTPNRSKETDIVLKGVKSAASNLRHSYAVLSKFYFCKQVDLEPEEFIDHGTRVYFNVTGRFLEEAEFRRTWLLNGGSVISVCVEEFGENFWEQSNTASAYAMWLTGVVTCSVIIGQIL